MKLPRIMLAAPYSGSGKTLISCGILQALKNRGKRVQAFKCGPDYIDPMFHTKVIGAPSRNLDTFFADEETVRYLFARQAMKADISVMEGVMGFYDGLAGISPDASSYDLARKTDTPVILVVRAKGMSLSVVPYIKGFLEYKKDSNIRGLILNQVSAMIYPDLKRLIEEELPVKVLGYVPMLTDCLIESRHLGLVMPGEIEDIKERLERLAAALEQTLDMDAIIELADQASDFDDGAAAEPDRLAKYTDIGRLEAMSEDGKPEDGKPADGKYEQISEVIPKKAIPRIAVARDEAFCFYYADNLQLLEDMGAELIYFSPLHDEAMPDADGLLIGGGYPELYAQGLSDNESMKASIKDFIDSGRPCIAECGGFMYLHESMEDMDRNAHSMVGAVPGHVSKTDKLGRFGYITLTANEDSIYGPAGAQIKAHEFHYFDSSNNGAAFHAKKPLRKKNWDCIVTGDNLAAGFPHLYYYSNPDLVFNFLRKCRGEC